MRMTAVQRLSMARRRARLTEPLREVSVAFPIFKLFLGVIYKRFLSGEQGLSPVKFYGIASGGAGSAGAGRGEAASGAATGTGTEAAGRLTEAGTAQTGAGAGKGTAQTETGDGGGDGIEAEAGPEREPERT